MYIHYYCQVITLQLQNIVNIYPDHLAEHNWLRIKLKPKHNIVRLKRVYFKGTIVPSWCIFLTTISQGQRLHLWGSFHVGCRRPRWSQGKFHDRLCVSTTAQVSLHIWWGFFCQPNIVCISLKSKTRCYFFFNFQVYYRIAYILITRNITKDIEMDFIKIHNDSVTFLWLILH